MRDGKWEKAAAIEFEKLTWYIETEEGMPDANFTGEETIWWDKVRIFLERINEYAIGNFEGTYLM